MVWGLAGLGRAESGWARLSRASPLPLPCRASREHPSVQEKKKSTIWQL